MSNLVFVLCVQVQFNTIFVSFAAKYSRYHSCGIPACRGIGNANNESPIHLHAVDCPYTKDNWIRNDAFNRLKEYDQIVENLRKQAHKAVHGAPLADGNHSRKRIKLQHTPPSEESRHNQRSTTPVVLMVEAEPIVKVEVFSEDSCETDTKHELLVGGNATNTPSEEKQPTDQDELVKRIAASESILKDYGPTLSATYHLWRENSRNLFRNVADGEDSIKTSNPLLWTVHDVARRVAELPGCSQLASRFEENEIDGSALLMLSQEDLIETALRLRTGQAIKVFNYIALLREEVTVRWLVQ